MLSLSLPLLLLPIPMLPMPILLRSSCSRIKFTVDHVLLLRRGVAHASHTDRRT